MIGQVDILAVVRQYLDAELVERAPGDFWACCPFHDEDTPSFHVRQREGRFKCFGCGASGDAIDFVRQVQGIGYREAVSTLERIGMHPSKPTRSAVQQRPKGSPTRLPEPRDLNALIRATVPVTDDAEVAAYLRGRGLDPAEMARRGSLARALRIGTPCPAWARKSPEPGVRGQPWPDVGYRIITPLFSPGCWDPVSFRGRRLNDDEPKSVAGAGITTKNQVMADELGRYLITHGRVPDDWPPGAQLRVAIAEGEPDFWTLATLWPDAHPSPAVLGVVSGAWSPEIARCIPSGTVVEVRTDPDPGGDRMADAILETLGRRCTVERVRARVRT